MIAGGRRPVAVSEWSVAYGGRTRRGPQQTCGLRWRAESGSGEGALRRARGDDK